VSRRHTTNRTGFSLLEILLALAILGGSLAILSSIASTGVSSAREARDLTVARLLCQSKLSELLLDSTVAGIAPQAVPLSYPQRFGSGTPSNFIARQVKVTQRPFQQLPGFSGARWRDFSQFAGMNHLNGQKEFWH